MLKIGIFTVAIPELVIWIQQMKTWHVFCKLQCDEGKNSPLNRPEFVDIDVGKGLSSTKNDNEEKQDWIYTENFLSFYSEHILRKYYSVDGRFIPVLSALGFHQAPISVNYLFYLFHVRKIFTLRWEEKLA